jgi:hypothetical protein
MSVLYNALQCNCRCFRFSAPLIAHSRHAARICSAHCAAPRTARHAAAHTRTTGGQHGRHTHGRSTRSECRGYRPAPPLRCYSRSRGRARECRSGAAARSAHAWGRCTAMYRLEVALIYAPVLCALLYVVLLVLSSAPVARRTSAGKPACERCGVQLNRIKHHRPCGVGRACAPQCKQPRSTTPPSAVSAATASSSPPAPSPSRKRKRRADSDPGEQSEHTLGRLRVRAPRVVAPDKKKQKQDKEAALSALLDAAHARRMALLAQAGASSSSVAAAAHHR